MNPKEKAKELVDKFKDVEIGSEGFHSWGMSDWQARQCALICVDEILFTVFTHKNSYDYWQDVKKEIELL